MKYRVSLLITLNAIAVLFSACASHKTIDGPDGTPHVLVSCGKIEVCYEKAKKACDGKYKIANTSNAVSTNADTGTTSSIDLLVKCETK